MNPVFNSLWVDLLAAGLLGALGGLGLGLLQERGLELPHSTQESGIRFIDLGFIGDMLVGILAAVLMYALNPPEGLLQLIATGVPAGVGGSAVLKGYIQSTKLGIQANRAEMYRMTAWEASRGMDVSERLQSLEQADAQMKRRWGAW